MIKCAPELYIVHAFLFAADKPGNPKLKTEKTRAASYVSIHSMSLYCDRRI